MARSISLETTNRILVFVALVALTPVLLLVVELPIRSASFNFLGTPLSIRLTTDSLLILFMPVLTAAGVDWVLRNHPSVRAGEVPFLFPFWMAPGLAALTLALLLTRITSWPLWVASLLIGVVVIAILVFAEYVTIDPNVSGYAAARLIVMAISYVIAFGLFTLIYSARERTIVSATSMMLVALALSLDLLAPHIIGLKQAGLFALIVAWLIGQATWALNYWNISNWSAGVLLLTLFYAAIGVAQQHFQDRLTRSVLLEFGIVSLFALIVVWQLAQVR
jgi:hypothetical protein